jgi:hypothetical protein
MPTTPFTELEAVNEMLMSIGQAPVNSLVVTVGDVNIARSILGIETRYVLLYGFGFNTDEAYSLAPDANKFIAMPNSALEVDASDKQADIVMRRHPSYGVGLYDRANQTFEFGTSVPCDIVWGMGFEDLPESARNYIAMAAVRKFQKRTIGSAELDGYNQEDEARAWSLLLRNERRNRDTNSFRKSKSLQRSGNRTGFGLGYGYSYNGPITE